MPVLIVLFAFYSIATVFFAIGIRRSNKPRQSKLPDPDTVTQVVREAVGELPATQMAPPPKKYPPREQLAYLILACGVFTLIYLALYYSIDMGVSLVRPDLAEGERLMADIAASLFIPLIMGWLILPLVTRWIILSPSENRFTDRRKIVLSMLDFTQFVAIASASIAMPIIVEIAYGWLSAFVAFAIYYFVFIALWKLVSKSALYFPRYWVSSALANAEYDEAIRRIQHLETRFSHGIATLYNRGTVLLFAGQFTEAEKFLRQSLQEAQILNTCLPEALTNLGYTFLRQGRYDEATRAFQGATKLNPRGGHAYSGLAEVYLYQGIEPQQALALIVQFLKSNSRRQVKDRSIWGSLIGDEAWALALLGRPADARQALRQAFELTDKSFKPGLASLHFREGKVYQTLGDRLRAIQSFQLAIQLDPAGAYGKLSRQALEDSHSEGT